MAHRSPPRNEGFGSFTARQRRQLHRRRRASWSRCSGRRARGKTTLLRIIAGLETRRRRHRCCSKARTPPTRNARDRARRLRLPALRAVPAHDGVRERRVRPARAAARRAAVRRARSRASVDELLEAGAARLPGRPLSVAAVGRPAAARRAGARAGGRAEGAAARRAVRRARREGPAGAAPLAAPAARRDSPHQRVRHPRSGGGARARRPRRRS